MQHLAAVLHKTGRYEEAEELYQETLKLEKKDLRFEASRNHQHHEVSCLNACRLGKVSRGGRITPRNAYLAEVDLGSEHPDTDQGHVRSRSDTLRIREASGSQRHHIRKY